MKTGYGQRSLGAYLPFPVIQQDSTGELNELAGHTFNQCSSENGAGDIAGSQQRKSSANPVAQSDLRFDVLERGRRLFEEGYEAERIGAIDAAEALYRQSIEQLEAHIRDHGLGGSRAEFARIALEHGTFLCRMGRIDSARAALARAVELFEEGAKGDLSAVGIRELATALSWYSLVQRKVNDFEGALSSYIRAVSLWNSLFNLFGPMFGNIDVRQSLAINLIGLSKTYRALGNERQAAFSLQESHALLNITPKSTAPIQ